MDRKLAKKLVLKMNFDEFEDKANKLVDEIFDGLEGTLEEKKFGPWVWVKTEYCSLFIAKNIEKGGYIKESISRMKKMFAANPEIRKEDVIGATKLYLSSTDSRYIRYPHYFLKKGQGSSAVYEFLNWYEKYKEAEAAGEGRVSKINTMQ